MKRPNTFGGSLLDRFIDYETTEGAGDSGTIPADPAPPADPGADPAPVTPEAAPADAPSPGEQDTPAWAGIGEDDWQAYQARQAQLEAHQAELTQYLIQQQQGGQPDT